MSQPGAQIITIDLPWPHKGLSPNARLHFHQLARLKKRYRADCYLLTKAARVTVGPGRHSLSLVFFPPDPRPRDRDNLLASMKSGIDGMADALGVNDRNFDPVSASVAQGRLVKGGAVRITLAPYEDRS